MLPGPTEYLIVVVIVWMYFRRFPTDFFNSGGAVPVKPTREPIRLPEHKKPEWVIQDQPNSPESND